MSEVMQVEVRLKSRCLAGTFSATVVAIGLVLLSAFDAGAAAAEKRTKLSGVQIRAKFSGRQLTDEVHWRDVYERDGALRTYSMGRKRTGKWFVRANTLCLDLPEPDGGCLEVMSVGSHIELIPTGTGLTIEGVLQPISDQK